MADAAAISLQEISLCGPIREGCDPSKLQHPEQATAAALPNAENASNSNAASDSDSDSDGELDDELAKELDLKQLDVLATQDTEEALERLMKWVRNKSRKLSLSSQDREIFARLTDKYFSELKSLSREVEARSHSNQAASEPGPSSPMREAAAGSAHSSSRPPSRTQSNAPSEASVRSKASGRSVSETSSDSAPRHLSLTVNVEEGSVSSIEAPMHRGNKVLLFPEEHGALFSDDSEENKALLTVLQRFLSDDRDYFHSISLAYLFKVFKYLLLYYLESEYNFEMRHESQHQSQHVSRATDALLFYKRLFDSGLAPHTFRQVYEKLTQTQSHLQVGVISDRINNQDYHQDIFLLHGLLNECFQVYQSRTGVNGGLDRMNFRCPAACSLCLLDDQLVMSRSCCGQHVCYACYAEWVRTKVFARTVEVGCPCCSCFLTVSEIIEFLGDRAERYYEVLTDLNGDPDKKTCPQCSLITKNPNEKANKRLGGELTLCQRCEFRWCFRCHSPPHPGLSCRANTSDKQMLRDWGLETYFDGSQLIRKARKCPSCKIYIEKNQGCNHMTCNRCNYQFCYVCGKNWRAGNIVFGRHSSRLSIFGCKQKLFPDRPALRKLVRGTLFVLESTGIVIVVPIALALVIGLSPILGVIGLGVVIYKCKH